jgi:DNA-binding transcriptional MerR regulator
LRWTPLLGIVTITLDQLPRLHRILALTDLGFYLEQISRFLEDDLSPVELHGMLKLKKNELRQQVQKQLDRLERLEARLSIIEQENQLPDYEVILNGLHHCGLHRFGESFPLIGMKNLCGLN